MVSFIFAEMEIELHFFIPLCLFEIFHIMIFNVTCEIRSITYT